MIVLKYQYNYNELYCGTLDWINDKAQLEVRGNEQKEGLDF